MPVDPSALAAFAVAAAAIVVSPGPDTAFILRAALGGGWRAGLAAVAGIQTGLVVHTALAAAGISLLIASSPALLKAVAGAGALYLGWLGIGSFRNGWAVAAGDGSGSSAARPAFGQAILCNLLNPKVILLYLALFPNFVEPARGQVPVQLATLSAVLIAINVAWQAPLAWLAHGIGRRLAAGRRARTLARASGAVLVAFALLLLYENFA